MGEQRADGLMRGAGAVKRRGLLAGAVALAGAGLAKLTGPGHAEAAHTAPEDVLHADVVNTTTGTTEIQHTGNDFRALLVRSTDATYAFEATAVNGRFGARGASDGTGGIGVEGVAGGGLSFGVLGNTGGATTNASGVRGVASFGATNGVWGQNYSSADSCDGVFGLASAATGATVGVWGRSQSGTPGATGTLGEATAPSGATIGVLGRVSSPAGIAVRGNGGSGVGVFGGSTGNIGVYADSVSGSAVFATSPARAVWGRTMAGIGVFAQATAGGTVQNRSYGLYAAAPGPGWAGYFEGNVYVTGSMTVASGAKSAAVEHPDGSQRRMYCQEAPEPWFEDFGQATLMGGRATVTLDKDFAAVVKSDDYAVFPVPEGDCGGLYVTAKTPAKFEVHELKGGASSVPFRYRVVAKRKDAVGGRLEKIERPKKLDAKDVEPPKLPEASTLPSKPPSEPERPTPRPVGRPVPGSTEAR